MKIYDCFTFYNEFDLLELRLKLHWDHVDYFVIVESDHTFQNKPKPYMLKDNWARFSKWHSKIRLITIESDCHLDPWDNERDQRNAILNGLDDANPHDIAIIGDVDEVLRTATFESMQKDSHSVFGFRMPLFNFKLNYMLSTTDSRYCVWNGATRIGMLNDPESFRRMRHTLNSFPLGYADDTICIIEHAGWHWTYFGDSEFAKTKIQGFSHSETNKPEVLDQLNIEASIADGRGIIRTDDDYRFCPVMVDSYFPDIVKLRKDLLPADKTVWSFLPKA